jgi:hypothetical protein
LETGAQLVETNFGRPRFAVARARPASWTANLTFILLLGIGSRFRALLSSPLAGRR